MKNTKEYCTAYYGWSKDDKTRLSSSSGGFFTELSNYVISQNGLVIGAYFDSTTKTVSHDSSERITIDQMRRSKYVESDMRKVIPIIRKMLDEDRVVLFCGTPCQCAGLRKLFGKNERVILCDFFCHGVPSPKVFEDYLSLKEKEKKAKITDFQFRTKDFGWNQYGERIYYKDGKIEKTVGRCEFFYTASMLRDEFLRESCYTCDKAMYHASDFTIGDFWGVNQLGSNPSDGRKGISAVVANTAYALELLNHVQKGFVLNPLPKHFLNYAFKVKTGDKKIKTRNQRFEEYKRIGIVKYIKKYYALRLNFSRLMFQVKKHKFTEEV